MIDQVFVAQRDAHHPLADQRAPRVLDQVLTAPIAKAGGEAVEQPHRSVRRTQKQRTGIRRDRPAAKIGHHNAAIDPSEVERILDTLCRHRGNPSIQLKSFSQNNFR